MSPESLIEVSFSSLVAITCVLLWFYHLWYLLGFVRQCVLHIHILYFFSVFIFIFAAVRSGVQRPDYIPTTLSGLVWFSELTAVSCSVFYSIMQYIAVHYNVVYSHFFAVN